MATTISLGCSICFQTGGASLQPCLAGTTILTLPSPNLVTDLQPEFALSSVTITVDASWWVLASSWLMLHLLSFEMGSGSTSSCYVPCEREGLDSLGSFWIAWPSPFLRSWTFSAPSEGTSPALGFLSITASPEGSDSGGCCFRWKIPGYFLCPHFSVPRHDSHCVAISRISAYNYMLFVYSEISWHCQLGLSPYICLVGVTDCYC